MTSTSPLESTVPLYLAGLRLEGKRCLIVGGGAVAARKLRPLLEAGARVTVVAPALGRQLRESEPVHPASDAADAADRGGRHRGGWRWIARAFRAEDVQGQMLVFAATDDAALNEQIGRTAAAAGALANLATSPEASDFHVPSAFRRGSLQVGVLTGGRAPALAASLRRELEARVGEEWEEVVEVLGEFRDSLTEQNADQESRQELNRELAHMDIAGLLAKGGVDAVRSAVQDRLRQGETRPEPCA